MGRSLLGLDEEGLAAEQEHAYLLGALGVAAGRRVALQVGLELVYELADDGGRVLARQLHAHVQVEHGLLDVLELELHVAAQVLAQLLYERQDHRLLQLTRALLAYRIECLLEHLKCSPSQTQTQTQTHKHE